jgi:hypothetical protein
MPQTTRDASNNSLETKSCFVVVDVKVRRPTALEYSVRESSKVQARHQQPHTPQ